MLDCWTPMKGLQMSNTKRARPWNEGKETKPAGKSAYVTTLLASAPGVAEQSLRATLESLPSVQVVGTAAGCLSALQVLRASQADLVVIDSNLPLEDVREFLQQLRQEGLQTRSLVLAATSSQARHALAAGADVALRRDTSIRQLSAVVNGLHLASSGSAHDLGREVAQETENHPDSEAKQE